MLVSIMPNIHLTCGNIAQFVYTVLLNSTPYKILKFAENFMSSPVFGAIIVIDCVDYDVDMKLGFIFMDGIDGLELFAQIANDFLPD